jgi:hypothetical protein
MKQAYMNSGFNGAPIVIGGGGALQRVWMNDSRYFGQGANGINFATVRDNTGIADFYFDNLIEYHLGLQPVFVVFLGFVEFVLQVLLSVLRNLNRSS